MIFQNCLKFHSPNGDTYNSYEMSLVVMLLPIQIPSKPYILERTLFRKTQYSNAFNRKSAALTLNTKINKRRGALSKNTIFYKCFSSGERVFACISDFLQIGVREFSLLKFNTQPCRSCNST